MNDERKYVLGAKVVSITSNLDDYQLPNLVDTSNPDDYQLPDLVDTSKQFRVLAIDTDHVNSHRLTELLRAAHIEPALDSSGHITEVSIVPDRWTSPSVEEIRQNIEAVGNADTAVSCPVTVLPNSFLDAFLNAPRKLKKSWNTSGLFVSLRSRRGRRDTRKHNQQLRKLERDLKTGVIKP